MWLLLIFVFKAAATDYQYQISLDTAKVSDAIGFELQLPDVVYQKVSDPNLRDLRVKNAQGDEVPMRLTLTEDDIKQSLSATTLPIFSLNHSIKTPLRSKLVSTTWQGDEQQFTVETSESIKNFIRRQEQVLTDRLLLDATALKQASLAALQLSWQFEQPGNRVFYVELKGSYDLSNWQTVKLRHKLIELDTGQRVVLENTIALNIRSFDYYQLRFLDAPIPEVTAVKAMLQNSASEQPWLTRDVQTFEVLDAERYGHAIVWDTGGFFPIELVEFAFDYNNLMAEAQLHSRNSLETPWQRVKSSQLYQVGSGDMAMENNSINVRSNPHRYWKLTTQSSISSQWINGVSMKWRPHKLQFLAQGNGPYSVFFGAEKLKYSPSSRWYQQLNGQLKTQLFSKQIKAGGLMKLTVQPDVIEPEPDSTVSRWVFWGLLVVVLSALFYMASRLMKEVGAED